MRALWLQRGGRPACPAVRCIRADPARAAGRSDRSGLFADQLRRMRTPAHRARGSAGESAFSFVQLAGAGMKLPLAVNAFRLRNPAVKYSLSNKLTSRAKISACFPRV